MPRNLIEYLHKRCIDSFFEAQKTVLTAYSSRSSLKSRTFTQNMYIYTLLAVSSQFVSSLSVEQRDQLHRLVMKGIEDHMKNTSSEVRNCCLFLGQTLLNLLSNEVNRNWSLKLKGTNTSSSWKHT